MTLDRQLPVKSRTAIRGGTVTVAGQGVKFFVLFGSQIVLAHLLPVDQFGIVALFAPVLFFAQVLAEFGLATIIVQREEISEESLNELFWLNIAIGVLTSLIFVVVAVAISAIFAKEQSATLASLLGLTVFFNSLRVVQTGLLMRDLRFGRLLIIDLSGMVVGTTASVFIAAFYHTVLCVFIGALATALVSLIIAWIGKTSFRPSAPVFTSSSRSELKNASSLVGLNLFSSLNSTVDNLLIGIALGSYQLGLYDRAWKSAAVPLAQLVAPSTAVAVPYLSRTKASGLRYNLAFAALLRSILFMTTPGLTVVMVNATVIMSSVYGVKWVAAGPALGWVCLGSLVTPVNIAAVWLFTSQNRNREQFRWSSLCMLVNLCAYGLGIPWGINGVAAISASSVVLIQTPILVWASCRVGPVGAGVIVRILLPVIGLAIAIVVAHLILTSVWGSSAGIAILEGLIGYLVALILFCSTESGRGLILRVRDQWFSH